MIGLPARPLGLGFSFRAVISLALLLVWSVLSFGSLCPCLW